jgi:hypothetical protein
VNKADVAELVDARDLKSVGPFDYVELPCKTRRVSTIENDGTKRDLQNTRKLTGARPNGGGGIRILRARKDYTNGKGVSKIGVNLGNRTQIDLAKRAFRTNPAASLMDVVKQEGVAKGTAVRARKELIAAGEIQTGKARPRR